MNMIHDLKYFKDHDVEDLELFLTYRSEMGPINRTCRDPDWHRMIRRSTLILTGLPIEWEVWRGTGFLITAHVQAEVIRLLSRI